jgi:signal transduction histidine kinase
MNKQRCHVTALMTNAADVMQAMAKKFGVTLAILPLPLDVWADGDRIIQTLTNLLSNAIKFSPQGTTVSLSAIHQQDHVLFQVSDQGRGIPADKLGTIFERFQQVDASDSRNQDGTGLGLAICRNIIQQHGGRIWVESTLGKGSTFYFTLPIDGNDGTIAPSST